MVHHSASHVLDSFPPRAEPEPRTTFLLATGDDDLEQQLKARPGLDGFDFVQVDSALELFAMVATRGRRVPSYDAVVLDARADKLGMLSVFNYLSSRDWTTPVIVLVDAKDGETSDEVWLQGGTPVHNLDELGDSLRPFV